MSLDASSGLDVLGIESPGTIGRATKGCQTSQLLPRADCRFLYPLFEALWCSGNTGMRVLLVMPGFAQPLRYGPGTTLTLPPLGLEYVAANVEDLAEVRLVDNRFEPMSSVENVIQQFRPDYVGISCNLSSQIHHVNRIAEMAKKVAPDSTTVVGGFHPSLVPDETLDSPWIDIVVRREGEATFRELVQKNSPVGTKGLSYKRDGHKIHNPDRDLLTMKDLRLPARHLRSRRMGSSYQLFGFPVESVEVSRGCPYSCRFCCIPVFYGHRYRRRSVPHVMRELCSEEIQGRARDVYIVDDNFTVDESYVSQLCDAIIRERLNMYFTAAVRVDTVAKHPALFERMARAGFFLVLLGIESFSDRALQKLHKQLRFREIKSAIRTLHSLGFIIQGNIILGADPDDTERDLESTIETAKTMDIDMPTFSLLTPYPGTDLMDGILAGRSALKLVTKDWRYYNWFTPTMQYPHLSCEQLSDALKRAYEEVPFFRNPVLTFLRSASKLGFAHHLPRLLNRARLRTLPTNLRGILSTL